MFRQPIFFIKSWNRRYFATANLRFSIFFSKLPDFLLFHFWNQRLAPCSLRNSSDPYVKPEKREKANSPKNDANSIRHALNERMKKETICWNFETFKFRKKKWQKMMTFLDFFDSARLSEKKIKFCISIIIISLT